MIIIIKKISTIVSVAIITICLSRHVYAKDNYNVKRITGENRYETSANISSEFSNSIVQNIIIASGNNFPDALTGSVLSNTLNAPILLVDKTIETSSNSIKYIKNHLTKGGTIYILGGNGSVNESFSDYFKSLDYNVKRLGGSNRFDTNKTIVSFMNVEKGTPVIVVNGYGFADALGISSIAASKGYPILMVNETNLPSESKDMLKEIQPSKVFIIGGEGSINKSVIDELKNRVPFLDNNSIVRISGSNRYETSLNVCKYFNLSTNSAIVVSGKSFPDALSGSALAAKLNAPIILTDGSNIIDQKRYLDSTSCLNLILLGGKGSVSQAAEDLLNGKETQLFYVSKGYKKDGKKYIDGYFDKFVTDLNEARDYEKRTGNFVIWNDHDGTVDYLPDDGFDMAISNTVTLEVNDNVNISEIDFNSEGNILNVNKDFNSIIVGKYKSRPVFDITLKDYLITKMHQEYRP
ncbi:cell wall-binding repeat-containing protein [Clostridium bowmanii]|uniref:cell wall-binding repeat-containing protein n=1 Tax=Clostridium bowmanii TaxID=132925 RepID=UPI001C0D0AA6|nr:cell wall-binding repeat-containing protein [Clostridium bowmanii]MBU3188369.1 cell wall-binding repeat-containing protein [Clostridium bowmanii]MCA1072758.1 cell wall-binding repeat-containing protein [Clostridium bowmanii]